MTYRDILASDYFFETYSKIEFSKRDFPVNHGFIHVWHVIKNAKYLSKLFDLNAHEEELLLIASALHDVGYLEGRDDHAKTGAIKAREYLSGKIPESDVDIICRAIASHGGHAECDFECKVSRSLIMADKLDFERTRYREDHAYKSVTVFLSVEKVELIKREDSYEIEVLTTDKTLFDGDAHSFYFNKLQSVLEKLSKVLKKNIDINIKQI